MPRIFIVKRKQLALTGLVVLLAAALYYLNREAASPVDGKPAPAGERVIHMVTGEFKSTLADGKEIEAYRWDPGTIYVRQGEHIRLSIYGVNGENHPFIIEGLNLKGEVKKGKETILRFTAGKKGIYRIICLTHPDIAHNGPMIGYLVVD